MSLASETDLLAEFLIESQERLERIDQLLLIAERSAHDEFLEAITQLFREFHTLKGNASCLGYSNAAELCHAVESVFRELRDGERERDDGLMQALFAASDRTRELLSDPDSHLATDVSDVVSALMAPDARSTAPGVAHSAASGIRRPAAAEVRREAATENAPPAVAQTISDAEQDAEGHNDDNVYQISMLQSVAWAATNPDAWMVAQLSQLASTLSTRGATTNFANVLIDLFRAHDYFRDVDRVCLAGAVPESSQLIVVDSACSRRLGENTMRPGYSCYVNPQGSLFRLRPGMLRAFDDCRKVIHAFQRERKPVQRSIARVGAMGLRSGVCLPIGTTDRLSGFLFLNSTVPSLFDSLAHDYAALLSVLSVFAKSGLQSAGYGIGDETDFEEVIRQSKVAKFDATRFAELLADASSHRRAVAGEISVVNHSDEPFFVCESRLVGVCLAVLDAIAGARRSATASVVLHFGRLGDDLLCRIAHGVSRDDQFGQSELRRRLALVRRSPEALGFRIDHNEREAVFASYFEQAMSDTECPYSTVMPE